MYFQSERATESHHVPPNLLPNILLRMRYKNTANGPNYSLLKQAFLIQLGKDLNVFDLLALKGARVILVELSKRNECRYSELVEAVGHSTTTSRALNMMEELGYIKREVLQEKYRPVVYSLSVKGKELAGIVKILMELENR